MAMRQRWRGVQLKCARWSPPQDLWCPQTGSRRVFSVSLQDYLVSQ